MTYYNHFIFKKMVVVFGKLLVDMRIKKFENDNIRSTSDDSTTTTELQSLLIPISYGQKNKLISRYLRRQVSLKGVAMTLPRMAFEITNVYYDSERKLNRLHKYINTTADNKIVGTEYTPVPYNFDVELSIITNRNDDATKIAEQILPRFTPDIKVTTNLIEEMNLEFDIPIVLNAVHIEDIYEKPMDQDGRVIIWGMNFTIKGYLFRETNQEKIITTAVTNLGIDINSLESSTITIDPVTAQYNEDYGFTES